MSKRVISNIIAGRKLISGTPDMTIRAACKLMAEKNIGALLILENNKAVGIFTERDVLIKVVGGGIDPDKTQVAKVMVKDPQSIRGAQSLAYALLMMMEGGYRHVPVTDDEGNAVGIVSSRDALGEDLERLGREMKRREVVENPRH